MSFEELLKVLAEINKTYVAEDGEANAEVFQLELGRLATKHLKGFSKDQRDAILHAALPEVAA